MTDPSKYDNIPDDMFVPIECVPNKFIGKYEVNKLGHIKNVKTGNIRKNISPSEQGYPMVYFFADGEQISIALHIILAKTFISNPDRKPIVDHINRDRGDCRLSNLRWVTYSENNINRTSTKRSEVLYEKYDLSWNYIETISGYDMNPRYRDNVNHGIKDDHSSHGFRWKKVDPKINDYVSRFGAPKEEDWKDCPRIPEFECNLNGMIRSKADKKPRIGSKSADGYLNIKVGSHQYSVHRLIYETFSGEQVEEGFVIDHISTVRDDNRFVNLRKCTQSENVLNPLTASNKSKKIELYSLDGNLIREFSSVRTASMEIGIKDYLIYQSIQHGSITNYGIFTYKSDHTKLNLTLDRIIYKYDYYGNLIRCFPNIKEASDNSSSCPVHMTSCINEGQFCSDGFYYSVGKLKSPIDPDLMREAREKFIFRYDRSGQFTKRFSSVCEAERDSTVSRYMINTSIRTGTLCSDGFYYTRGPREEK